MTLLLARIEALMALLIIIAMLLPRLMSQRRARLKRIVVAVSALREHRRMPRAEHFGKYCRRSVYALMTAN